MAYSLPPAPESASPAAAAEEDDSEDEDEPVAVTAAALLPLELFTGFERVGAAAHRLFFPPIIDAQGEDARAAADAAADDDDRLARRLRRCHNSDYYGLLDLADRALDATDSEIRAKYRKINLLLHPDKATPKQRAAAELRFKALQKGT